MATIRDHARDCRRNARRSPRRPPQSIAGVTVSDSLSNGDAARLSLAMNSARRLLTLGAVAAKWCSIVPQRVRTSVSRMLRFPLRNTRRASRQTNQCATSLRHSVRPAIPFRFAVWADCRLDRPRVSPRRTATHSRHSRLAPIRPGVSLDRSRVASQVSFPSTQDRLWHVALDGRAVLPGPSPMFSHVLYRKPGLFNQ